MASTERLVTTNDRLAVADDAWSSGASQRPLERVADVAQFRCTAQLTFRTGQPKFPLWRMFMD
uniref:hypothetical protein n=1 Tax=Klebsiella michiganensis TaxID=1134687 RepID=UPI001952DEF3